jgi:HD-like signal output (HDOD) protein
MPLPTKAQILDAIAKTDNLLPAPRTLGRALQLLRNPDSGLSDIVELINRDSALAADVLRCANSAFYGRNTKIGAVGEAVQVIGFHETIRLVSLVAAHNTTNRDLGCYGIAAEEFWIESLFSGLFLDALAKRTRAADAGEAYTVGLMRFIGRVAINQALQDLGGSLFWTSRNALPDWERENVGLTQAEVGAGLLRKWQFPEPITLAVELQDHAPSATAALATEPLALAMNFTACLLPAGFPLPEADAEISDPSGAIATHPFAVAHQLTEASIRELLAEARRAFIAIRETLYH